MVSQKREKEIALVYLIVYVEFYTGIFWVKINIKVNSPVLFKLFKCVIRKFLIAYMAHISVILLPTTDL